MDDKEKVLDFIKREGPLLPVKVAKLLNTDIIMASARLSQLVSEKLIKISNTKIGGSPVYYVAGQEAKLEELYKYLAEMEKKAYNLLKEKKLLKDVFCEPAIRVALRNIPDFAIGFKYNEEFYWGWFLSTEEELMPLMKKFISNESIEKPKNEVKEKIKNEKEKLEVVNNEVVREIKEPLVKKVKEKIKNEKEKQDIVEKGKKIKRKTKEDEFLNEINNYVSSKRFNVLEELEGKKNKEVCKIIKINSDLGSLKYMLYAKNKKKISDADLSLAISKGQGLRLSVFFISNGELTKKAEKYLESNSFIVYRKI